MSMYVLQVLTGRETDIRRELLRIGFQALLPAERRMERSGGKWHERSRILMPGYVFLSAELSDPVYYQVRKMPGVLHFLNPGHPIALPADEEAYIREWSANGEPLAPSTIRIGAGDLVTVLAGPLVSMEGRIISMDRHRRRVTIAVTVAGKERRISLSAYFVQSQ